MTNIISANERYAYEDDGIGADHYNEWAEENSFTDKRARDYLERRKANWEQF